MPHRRLFARLLAAGAPPSRQAAAGWQIAAGSLATAMPGEGIAHLAEMIGRLSGGALSMEPHVSAPDGLRPAPELGACAGGRTRHRRSVDAHDRKARRSSPHITAAEWRSGQIMIRRRIPWLAWDCPRVGGNGKVDDPINNFSSTRWSAFTQAVPVPVSALLFHFSSRFAILQPWSKLAGRLTMPPHRLPFAFGERHG